MLVSRWDGTPLQDAVCTGHREVATALRLSGGTMSESFGSTRMFDAAGRGDVKNLSLLIKHAGLKVTFWILMTLSICRRQSFVFENIQKTYVAFVHRKTYVILI